LRVAVKLSKAVFILSQRSYFVWRLREEQQTGQSANALNLIAQLFASCPLISATGTTAITVCKSVIVTVTVTVVA
jgi:hypothetical protein